MVSKLRHLIPFLHDVLQKEGYFENKISVIFYPWFKRIISMFCAWLVLDKPSVSADFQTSNNLKPTIKVKYMNAFNSISKGFKRRNKWKYIYARFTVRIFFPRILPPFYIKRSGLQNCRLVAWLEAKVHPSPFTLLILQYSSAAKWSFAIFTQLN